MNEHAHRRHHCRSNAGQHHPNRQLQGRGLTKHQHTPRRSKREAMGHGSMYQDINTNLKTRRAYNKMQVRMVHNRRRDCNMCDLNNTSTPTRSEHHSTTGEHQFELNGSSTSPTIASRTWWDLVTSRLVEQSSESGSN